MKLYVPDIGDRLTLSKEWNFTLYDEHRNTALIKALDYTPSRRYYNTDMRTWPATLPAGVVLVIDRVYIRKGKQMGDYSSITFRTESTKDKELKKFNKCRFWVKISDANEIEFDRNKLSKRTMQVDVGNQWNFSLGSYATGGDRFENLTKKTVEEIKKQLVGKTFEVLPAIGRNGSDLRDQELTQLVVNFEEIDRNVAQHIKNLFRCNLSNTISDVNSKSLVSYKKLNIKYYRRIDEIVYIPKEEHGGRFFSASKDCHSLNYTNFYELYDEDKLIGKWSSCESLIKNAKEILTKYSQDSAHEKINSAQEMFEM